MFIYGYRRNNRNARFVEQSFGDVLIHADSRAGYIRAHVRHHRQFQQALQRAVFAECAVKHGKHNVQNNFFIFVFDIVKMQFVFLLEMIDQPRAAFFQSQFSAEILIGNYFRLVLHIPAAVSVNADGRYFIFFPVKGGKNRSGGAKRNIVLTRPAAV